MHLICDRFIRDDRKIRELNNNLLYELKDLNFMRISLKFKQFNAACPQIFAE